jgi:hypothetical protein
MPTASTNNACASPIPAPSHHVVQPMLSSIAAYRNANIHPLTTWNAVPTTSARSLSDVRMVPRRKGMLMRVSRHPD